MRLCCGKSPREALRRLQAAEEVTALLRGSWEGSEPSRAILRARVETQHLGEEGRGATRTGG